MLPGSGWPEEFRLLFGVTPETELSWRGKPTQEPLLEGKAQYFSPPRQGCFEKNIVSVSKASDLNWLVEGIRLNKYLTVLIFPL